MTTRANADSISDDEVQLRAAAVPTGGELRAAARRLPVRGPDGGACGQHAIAREQTAGSRL